MFFIPSNPKSFNLLIALSLIFIIFNLLIIDLMLLKKDLSQNVMIVGNSSIVAQKSETVNQPSECPNSCMVKINALSFQQKEVVNQQNLQPANSSVKEFFVAFGSGSNSTDDWVDVPGIQTYIDSSMYGQIKTVTFEAAMHIPTGNERAYVRLFNKTDQHPVWFSELSLEGGSPQLLISNPITLDLGKKLYQVQMKTSLKYQAVLDQARVHILTY